MSFSEQFLYELTSRSDIVQIASRYVSLTRRGSSFVGLCPFHNEKTPSFNVSADKQFYYCFGCGAGGDVISFVMGIENLSFPDTVIKLADSAGISVPEQTGGDFAAGEKKKRAMDVCRDAAHYYHEALNADSGNRAREYLSNRGISPATVKAFGLGYSPPEWDGLINSMTDKGYTKAELLDAGLILPNKSGGFYDRFRNRLMFPIIDVRGEVIGFGGRVMDGSEPKYLNSPETLVFNKRKNLFALNFARKSKRDYFILAEGYMDVISLHQAGFTCAIASLGTALTEEQVRMISRHKNEVIIAFDSDKAGVSAAERAIELFKMSGINVRVLRMKDAKDPDEYIKKFGRERFSRLLSASQADTEYRLDTAMANFDLNDDAQRVLYMKEAVEILAGILSPIERDIYISRVAEAVKVSKDAVLSEVNRRRKDKWKKSRKEQERRDLSPVKKLMPASRDLKYGNPKSAFAEEGLISLLMGRRELIPKAEEKLLPEHFSSELLSRIYKLIIEQYKTGSELAMTMVTLRFSPEEASHIAAILARNITPQPDALGDYIDTIKKEYLRRAADSEDDTDILLHAAEYYRKKKGYGGK